jgi:hypothetical protein
MKRIAATMAAFLLFNSLIIPVLDVRYAFADAITDAAGEGKTFGQEIMQGYTPENINTTLQNKGLGTADTLAPQVDQAVQQQGDYTGYYGNPGSMSTGDTNTDVGSFITDSHENRPQYDLTNDPVFGNSCLERDAEGKCIQRSGSQNLIENAYPDCERTMIPQYDDPPTDATCRGTSSVTTTACEITSYINVTQETVTTPCNQIIPEYHDGQIYAVCRDYYDFFKVFDHTGIDRDDCECNNHDTAMCSVPPDYSTADTPPVDASYLGMSYENYRIREQKDGWDDCTSDRYRWYTKYRHSVIERVILTKDSPCGTNVDKWAKECSVAKLEQCDPSGNNCVVTIENGEDTGEMPDWDNLTKVSQGTTTINDCNGCSFVWGQGFVCSDSCVGSCPSDAVLKSSPSSSAVKIGTQTAYQSFDCTSNPQSRTYETLDFYQDPRVCQSFAGSIENYTICMKYYSLELDNGRGMKQLINTPEREDRTTNYYGATVQWFHIYGSPDIKGYLNNWMSRVSFACENASNDCQALRDQGCVPYSQRCLDPNCNEIEYTYHCGGTGGITGYQVAYTCAGQIRCMGTECADASYTTNQDFGAVAAMSEVLNQYRADSDGLVIFPGEEMTCQSNPKDCCKTPDVGMSIADYVKLGKAAIEAYSLLSGGAVATWTSYANSISYVLSGGAEGTMSGLLGTSIADVAGATTNTVVMSSASVEAAEAIGADLMVEGEVYTAEIASQTVSTLATVATVLSIAMTVYTILNFVYDFVYQCDEEDIMTSYKNGLSLCHEVGTRCSDHVVGVCVKKEKVYCCFNTLLARIIHEQGRPQLGRGWGDADNPDCGGFSPGDLSNLDFSKIDLREYMQYIAHKTEISPEEAQAIMDRVKQNIGNGGN